jgi:uncharacterized phage protein (TIGR02218 family)
MSFVTLEQSNYAGQPVLLYEFKRGSAVFAYAAADKDIVANNGTVDLTYLATAISNSGQTQKGTAVTDVFEVTCPASLGIVQWYRYTPPSDTVYLAVRRFHYGDTQSVIVWLGQVVSVEESSEGVATIKCQQVSITLKRGGLRMTWQRSCIHALYDQNCTVNKATFATAVTVTAVALSGIITVTPHPSADAYWNGGIVEFELPTDPVGGHTGITERRLIENINTATGGLVPYGQLDGYFVGQLLTLYPGCKRTSEWCNSFFNNVDNFGGFEFMPNRSPYSGESVF